MVKSHTQNLFTISTIIDLYIQDLFFNNKDFSSIYLKYKYKFHSKMGKKIISNIYKNINKKIKILKVLLIF